MALETLFENLSLSPLTDSGEDDNIPSPSSTSQKLEDNIQHSSKIIDLDDNLTLNNTKMPDFKPEYLHCVPQFDGNPNELNRYLSICDSIIAEFYDAANPNNFHNVFLLNSLIGKLTGSAKLVVNIQSVTTWAELKETLYRNFADQRDESCLNRDLVLLRQLPNEKPQQFFDRCLQILNLICSYVDIHERVLEAKLLKRDLYHKLALKTFLSGLKEPLGTTIRCMRPKDLNEALQFIIQEENTQYYQNLTNKNYMQQVPVQTRPIMQQLGPINNFNRPVNNVPRNPFNNQMHSFNRQAQNNSPFNNQMPSFNHYAQNNQFRQQQNSFPSQPIHIQPRMNNPQQKFFTNSQVFKQPNQNVSRPNQNVFKPNPNRNLPNPTPMSGVSRQTSNNFQPGPSTPAQFRPPQRNFIPQELYNTEVNEIDEPTPNDNNYEYNNENVDETYENFNEVCYEDNVNFQQDPSTDDQT